MVDDEEILADSWAAIILDDGVRKFRRPSFVPAGIAVGLGMAPQRMAMSPRLMAFPVRGQMQRSLARYPCNSLVARVARHFQFARRPFRTHGYVPGTVMQVSGNSNGSAEYGPHGERRTRAWRANGLVREANRGHIRPEWRRTAIVTD